MSAPVITATTEDGDDRAGLAELIDRLREQVGQRLAAETRRLEEVDGVPLSPQDQQVLVQRLVREALDAHATACLHAGVELLLPQQESEVARAVRDAVTGFGALEPLMRDGDGHPKGQPEDIAYVNGLTFCKWEGDTDWTQVQTIARSDAEAIDIVRRIATSGMEERRFDRSSPVLSCELPDGSRLHATQSVSDGVTLTIRINRFPDVTLDDLVAFGMLDTGLREFFTSAIRSSRNIVITAETGGGKTTMLRALCSLLPPTERLITLEDTRELGLHRIGRHPNTVSMQARDANLEGQGRMTVADLFPSALRMRPDRVIVGEVRGQEIITMLNAMNNGNDGSLSTIHASSTSQAFEKMATYALQAQERLPVEVTARLVASAVHLVVHLGRDVSGKRVVSSVREVTGCDGMQVASNEIFAPDENGRAVPASPMSHALASRLEAHGFDRYLLQRPQGWWEATP
ncbi:ATPase, T2SS/T4P/T4SS family [Actinoplanes sp. NPDC051475]|uniref:CpaF family protein n=1 Tax=Actinoplanes sp. NPDC051475 TaxID=3157225 RepID=UPI00344EC245